MSVCHPSPTVSDLREELTRCLHRAHEHAGCPAALVALNRCLFVLDAMAISTADYALWRNRLRNARRYSEVQERGAAQFELRLLLHSCQATA